MLCNRVVVGVLMLSSEDSSHEGALRMLVLFLGLRIVGVLKNSVGKIGERKRLTRYQMTVKAPFSPRYNHHRGHPRCEPCRRSLGGGEDAPYACIFLNIGLPP